MPTPATVVISESNGAGETPTDNVSSMNYGSADVPNLVIANHPLVISASGTVHSFSKYHRLKVTAWGDTNLIDTIKVWQSAGSITANWGYVGAVGAYATPDRNSIGAPTFPTSEGSALTPSGSFSTPTTGYDTQQYVISQARISTSAAPNSTLGGLTITWQYNES